MNEFEALKRLRQETCPATYMPDFNKEECLEVIEKALLELKAIKEAKPSEALECLEKIGTIPMIVNEKTYDFKPIKKAIPNTYSSIKQALLKQLSGSQYTNIFIDETVKPNKELEALKIMKKYSKNDGWSNGWTIELWKASEKELKLINEVLE